MAKQAKDKKDEIDPDANRVDAGDPNASDALAVQDNDVVENAETGDVRLDHSRPPVDEDAPDPTTTAPEQFRRTAANAPTENPLHDPSDPQDGVQTEFEADRIAISHVDPPGVTRVKTVRMKGKGGQIIVNETDVEHYRAHGYKLVD